MKRLIPASVCIAVAICLAFGSYSYILKCSESLYDEAMNILASDEEKMYPAAEALYEKWNSVSEKFGVLLKHSDVDELADCFLRIKNYAAKERPEELTKALEDCCITLEVIKNGEKPDYSNIF